MHHELLLLIKQYQLIEDRMKCSNIPFIGKKNVPKIFIKNFKNNLPSQLYLSILRKSKKDLSNAKKIIHFYFLPNLQHRKNG